MRQNLKYLSVTAGVLLSSLLYSTPALAHTNYDNNKYLTEITTPAASYAPGNDVPVQFAYTNATGKAQWINTKIELKDGDKTIWERTYPVQMKKGQTIDVNTNQALKEAFTIPASVLTTDYKGYTIKATVMDQNWKVKSTKTSALAIESNPTVFPRYYVTAGSPSNSNAFSITGETLNKYAQEYEAIKNMHGNINMFYDVYQSSGSNIYPGTGTFSQNWASSFLGHAPTIDTSVVSQLVSWTHNNGGKALLYNMANSKESTDTTTNVSDSNYLYRQDNSIKVYDYGSNDLTKPHQIYYNLASADWQNHIFSEMSKAVTNGNFDGWQIDTIGDEEVKTSENAKNNSNDTFWISDTFSYFLDKAKESNLSDKLLALNSVGAQGMVDAAKAGDLAYTEIWPNGDTDSNKTSVWDFATQTWNTTDNHVQYGDIKRLVEKTKTETGKSLTVAAYVENTGNGTRTSKSKTLDTATSLLIDAATAASGGYHMTLDANASSGNKYGAGIIQSPYYGNADLSVSKELQKREQAYQNFITANENYLRGSDVTTSSRSVNVYSASTGAQLNKDDGQSGNQVWAFAKEGNNFTTVQLINLMNIDADWANTAGNNKTPKAQKNINVTLSFDSQAEAEHAAANTYITSPDGTYQGDTQTVSAYSYYDDDAKTWKVSMHVDGLEYWDMLVIKK